MRGRRLTTATKPVNPPEQLWREHKNGRKRDWVGEGREEGVREGDGGREDGREGGREEGSCSRIMVQRLVKCGGGMPWCSLVALISVGDHEVRPQHVTLTVYHLSPVSSIDFFHSTAETVNCLLLSIVC